MDTVGLKFEGHPDSVVDVVKNLARLAFHLKKENGNFATMEELPLESR